MYTLSALRALRLITRLDVSDIAKASYELFQITMGYEGLTDQHWAEARLVIRGGFQEGVGVKPFRLGELKEIFESLDYHIGLQGAGEAHNSSIRFCLGGILAKSRGNRPDPLVVKCIKKFDSRQPILGEWGVFDITSHQPHHTPRESRWLDCSHTRPMVRLPSTRYGARGDGRIL